MYDRLFNTKLAAVGLSFINAGACLTVTHVTNRLFLSPSIPTGAAVEGVTRIFEEGRLYFIPMSFVTSGLYIYLARQSARAFFDSPYTWAAIVHSLPVIFTFAFMLKSVIGPLSSAHRKGGVAGSTGLLGGEAEATRLIRLFGWLNLVRAGLFGVSGYIGLTTVMRGQ